MEKLIQELDERQKLIKDVQQVQVSNDLDYQLGLPALHEKLHSKASIWIILKDETHLYLYNIDHVIYLRLQTRT